MCFTGYHGGAGYLLRSLFPKLRNIKPAITTHQPKSSRTITTMATFFQAYSPLSHPFFLPFASPLPDFRAPPYFIPPVLRVAGDDPFRRKLRGSTVAARAGPSTNSIALAVALPLSLLAVTVFASIRIADKLDQQFYEEMAMNEAILQANEDDDDEEEDDDDDVETYAQEEPALPHTRNRPKREA